MFVDKEYDRQHSVKELTFVYDFYLKLIINIAKCDTSQQIS